MLGWLGEEHLIEGSSALAALAHSRLSRRIGQELRLPQHVLVMLRIAHRQCVVQDLRIQTAPPRG